MLQRNKFSFPAIPEAAKLNEIIQIMDLLPPAKLLT